MAHQAVGAEHQGLQLPKLIFDRFQRRGDAARLGFALCQGPELRGADVGDRTDGAEHELPVRQMAIGIDVESHRQGVAGFSRLEPAGLRESGSQQRLPVLSQTNGISSIPDPEIKTVALAKAFRHRRCMQPKTTAAVPCFHIHRGQGRGIPVLPAAQQQRWLVSQVGPPFALWRFDGGTRCRRPFVQTGFGQQQIAVGCWSGIQRQWTGHMPLSWMLGDWITIDLDLDHGRC